MSKFSIQTVDRDSEQDNKQWKQFLKNADGATIFHDPDFLAYHKSRFSEHHLGIFKGSELFGLLPMAMVETNHRKEARSPYGASYGGFVFQKNLNYSDSKEIVKRFIEYLGQQKVDSVMITPPLPIYFEQPSDTFLFALLEHGFKLINADISSVATLSGIKNVEKELLSTRARRNLKKADKADIKCDFNASVADFWEVMEVTFEKHQTTPTHTFDEWKWLCDNLPGRIWCDVAYLGTKPVAGIGHMMITEKVDSSFYICSDPEYQDIQAPTMLLKEILKKDHHKGIVSFDFGTSSVNMTGRDNIFTFKENFGCVGRFRNTYRYEFENTHTN